MILDRTTGQLLVRKDDKLRTVTLEVESNDKSAKTEFLLTMSELETLGKALLKTYAYFAKKDYVAIFSSDKEKNNG